VQVGAAYGVAPSDLTKGEKEPGKRTDLEAIIADAEDGMTMNVIIKKYSKTAARCMKWIQAVCADHGVWDYKTMGRSFTLISGPTGTGKTHYVCDKEPDLYIHPLTEHWWDGYSGQSAVLLDDATPETLKQAGINVGTVLRLTDRYDFRVPTRGQSQPFMCKRMYVTTNLPNLQDLFPGIPYPHLAALRRRMTSHLRMFEGYKAMEMVVAEPPTEHVQVQVQVIPPV